MTKTKLALPRPVRRRVSIRKLQTNEAAFQPRGTGLLENHVAKLMDALQRGDELDPIAVWLDPATDGLIVADGHHRLEAYRRSNRCRQVQVDIFKCDRRTAMLIPIKDNAKARLSLSEDDKRNWAWRMTIEGGRSKSETVAACGVGDGTVGRMRRVMKSLIKHDFDLPENWKEAQALERQDEWRDWTEEDHEEWQRQLVEKADAQFGASLSFLCKQSPVAAADLVSRCAGGEFPTMLDYLGYGPTGDDALLYQFDDVDDEIDF